MILTCGSARDKIYDSRCGCRVVAPWVGIECAARLPAGCVFCLHRQSRNRSLSSVQDELTEEEYEKQLKDVCMVLKAFEVSAEDVTALVDAEKKKPGTGAGGDNRGFDCVRIKLDVSAEGF